MIALIWYYRFYFTYFNIHGSEDTQRVQVLHGAEVWGEGCKDTGSRGVDWLSVLQSCPARNTTPTRPPTTHTHGLQLPPTDRTSGKCRGE